MEMQVIFNDNLTSDSNDANFWLPTETNYHCFQQLFFIPIFFLSNYSWLINIEIWRNINNIDRNNIFQCSFPPSPPQFPVYFIILELDFIWFAWNIQRPSWIFRITDLPLNDKENGHFFHN